MHLLLFSTEEFKVTEVKQAERTPKLEEPFYTDEKNALLVFIHITEEKDEERVREAVKKIIEAMELTGYKKVILCPFAHLDFKIAKPKIAYKIIKKVEEELSKKVPVTIVHFGSHKKVLLKIPATKTQVMSRLIPEPKKRGLRGNITKKQETQAF